MLLAVITLTGILTTAASALFLLKQDLTKAKQDQVKSVVTATSHQLTLLKQQHQNNILTEDAFLAASREMVYSVRYGTEDKEYLYLFDIQGNNVFHPFRPELEGTNMLDAVDAKGNQLVQEMVSGVIKDGYKHWDYYWPRPGGETQIHKVGYAVRIANTDWILGSGLYVDDIEYLFIERAITFSVLALLILSLCGMAAVRISRDTSDTIAELSNSMASLAAGELDHRIGNTGRQDELGHMARTLAFFRERIIENSRLRHANDHVRFLEEFDPVTKLLNRKTLGEMITREIQSLNNQSDNHAIAVMVLRLPLLRDINTQLGGQQRDQLMVSVADRLQFALPEEDILARYGDDSIAIVRPNIERPTDFEHLATEILTNLLNPFPLGSDSILLEGKLGISLYPEDGQQEHLLLGHAEEAVRAARQREQSWCAYSTLQQRDTEQRIQLWNDMQQALNGFDQLHLVYQPIYSLQSNEIVCAEVLLRWEHPEQGMISPAVFVPFAERTGLISRLDRWVTEAVARQLAQWKNDGIELPKIAINLSGISFLRADLRATIEDCFISYQAPLEQLELELTEGVLIEDMKQVQRQLETARQMNLKLSIDDFGTGYSSLSRIRHLNIDKVKIDRAFIQELEHNQQDRHIVETIIQMAHGLGLSVVAEGVETQHQLDILRQTNCDMVQGFFLNRPMPAEQFAALLMQEQELEIELA